jgi:ABC-2 type transport system ATP-binding protein
MSEFLSVQNVIKQYGSQRALDGVSFQVQAGECFGLLGPNGAGKTTLLLILSCLRAADQGQATLLGQPLHPSNQAIRQAIGIAPQEIALYGSLSGRENLAFFGSLYGLGGVALNKRVDSLLEAVGLQAKADAQTDTYSGGMLRRLNFAAALIHQPKLLLLDEPTAGVDPQSRNHLFEEIRRCNRNGTTIVYTTHYMEEVEALCDRVAIIDHGRIVACDSLPKLLTLMPSKVTITLPRANVDLIARLRDRYGEQAVEANSGKEITVSAPGSADTLAQMVRLLSELQVQPDSIQSEPANLERVFLHLTGRELRD